MTGASPGRALIVVDVQRDFCEGGSLGVDGGNALAARVAALLAGDHGYAAVLATRDHHIDPGPHFSDQPDFLDSWPPHCVVGTPGAELNPALAGTDFAAVFDKGEYEAAYSGFEGRSSAGATLTGWLHEHGIAAVDVCGIATDHCVRATALDAAREGFEVTVLLGLTAAVAPTEVARVVAEWESAGVSVAR